MTTVNMDKYPAGLVNWAGHHSGGVKRLLDSSSGCPNNILLQTNLLDKLRMWIEDYLKNPQEAPRIILLVGGPGNGKTEAIESTVKMFDNSLNCHGKLVKKLIEYFIPNPGTAIPRLVKVETKYFETNFPPLEISIVQDASMGDDKQSKNASELFIDELSSACEANFNSIYLGCVNRGILDDALLYAIEHGLEDIQNLLEKITQSVGLTPNSPACWPLKGYPDIAVWPMDIESLLVSTDVGKDAPIAELLTQVLHEDLWVKGGTCAAGDKCPFCRNRVVLSDSKTTKALLNILRWYELGSGKRWTFRDVFSLLSYLFAGHLSSRQGVQIDPCAWAAQQLALDKEVMAENKKTNKDNSKAIFLLASSCYQHALFHYWDYGVAGGLLKDIEELGLKNDPTASGFYHFLRDRKKQYTPATISEPLTRLGVLLDPATCNPDMKIYLSSKSSEMIREIDMRFSRSVEDGYTYIRKYHSLFWSELELLRRLSTLDEQLSSFLLNNKKAASARRIQYLLRDFSCRLVRRSLGARSATVKDCDIFSKFQMLVEDKKDDGFLYNVAKQVEDLLNRGEYFEVSLTTTFGQPLPPEKMRVTLVATRCTVRPHVQICEGRPHSPIPFLEIKVGNFPQYIALTYDLFKAVFELKEGIATSSLPHTVVALLDTTKARLSGTIVRNDEVLERAKIKIGASGTAIGLQRNGFAAYLE